MGLFDRLFGKNKKVELTEEELLDAGACPSCWGRQVYDDQIKEFAIDQTKSNINHDKLHKKAFVQQFVETHVTGIRLKKDGDQLSCPKCNGKYKYVSNKAT